MLDWRRDSIASKSNHGTKDDSGLILDNGGIAETMVIRKARQDPTERYI